MDDAICIPSNHDDLVGTVVYRGGVTAGDLDSRVGEIVHYQIIK